MLNTAKYLLLDKSLLAGAAHSQSFLMRRVVDLKKPIDFISSAIAITIIRRDECPQWDIYNNILKQLKFTEAVFNGTEKNRARLFDLSIGSVAVKEFEHEDPELARALMDAYSVAIQHAEGLKIQLPRDRSGG